MRLSSYEHAILSGEFGKAAATGMRIVSRMGDLVGAKRLIEITSAHIDGCLYHGDGGVEFAEHLVAGGGAVNILTTLNVGALDLLHPGRVRANPHSAKMARRLMDAYVKLGCRPTWTCAPYQVGYRPSLGEDVAWGESNAVAFVNSVLGARSNRYGDFLDICCALIGRAPESGLHLEENRIATVLINTDQLPVDLKHNDVFYPVFGTWLGTAVGTKIAVIDGLPHETTEDQLKALGAAASSSGSVGLFHVAGVSPEAPDLQTALGGKEPTETIRITTREIRRVRNSLSTTGANRIHAVAVGSPHFSENEFETLRQLITGKKLTIPFYVCTSRGVLERLGADDRINPLLEAGITIVVDTCVVVTPILPTTGGVLMTNSGKFAHYAPANTGYDVVYGTLAECVASAERGDLVRDESLWG